MDTIEISIDRNIGQPTCITRIMMWGAKLSVHFHLDDDSGRGRWIIRGEGRFKGWKERRRSWEGGLLTGCEL